jgi:hypothetical protein
LTGEPTTIYNPKFNLSLRFYSGSLKARKYGNILGVYGSQVIRAAATQVGGGLWYRSAASE